MKNYLLIFLAMALIPMTCLAQAGVAKDSDVEQAITQLREGLIDSFNHDDIGHLAESLDCALRHNPHYAYCRDLGQLRPVRLFAIAERGYETYAKRQTTQGARLGEIKPTSFSRTSGWSEVFTGTYV
jgi:hypothetical protein